MAKFKRILSHFLCFSLVFNLFAIEICAKSDKITIIACSDFQNPSGNLSGKAVVEGILNSMAEDGITEADGFFACGDYDYERTDTKDGIDTLKEAVSPVVSQNMVFVQGNHDSIIGTNGISTSGNNDPESGEYGVFVINEEDYMWYNTFEERIKYTAQNLIDYLNGKIKEKYDKPIFVLSHLPLHYNMRTKQAGDGMYANYIFDALNSAGRKGLNIFFIYGHNHSGGYDDYLGGGAVYLKKGDKILIAQGGQEIYQEEILNFTYFNAGYIGYYGGTNHGADSSLSMTAIEISNNEVTIKRFDDEGVHNLKSLGVRNTADDEYMYEPNETVYESPQFVSLTKVEDRELIGDLVDVSVDDYIIDESFDEYISWGRANANRWMYNKDSGSISVLGDDDNRYVSYTEGEIHKDVYLSEGMYEISYSIRPGVAKPLILLYSLSNSFHILSQCSTGGAVNTASWSQNVLANVDVNKWMTVKHLVDLDNGTATCKIYDEENNLLSESENAYPLMNGLSDIKKITIQNQARAELLIDNIMIKHYVPEEIDETILVEDTFDEISTQNGMTGWTIPAASAAEIKEYENGKYVVFSNSNFKRKVDPPATSGKYKISYKFKPGNSKPVIYMSGTGTGNVLLTEVTDGKLVTSSWASADMIEICTLDSTEKWVKIEAVIDLDKTSAKITVYDENGDVIGKHERDNLLNVDKNAELTNFTSFNVDNWNTSATLAFDDLKIEGWVEKPSLEQKNIEIINYKNEIQEHTVVSPAVKTITIDFGTPIQEMSGDLISIYPSVNYFGEVIDGMYVITMSEALEENTSYTITASADISNLIGDTLGEDVTVEFKTTTKVNEISFASLKNAEGDEITELSDILGKTVIIDSYVANCSDTDKEVKYIVALYKGNKFIKAYSHNGEYTVRKGAVSIEPVSVSVGNHQDITSACVFIWDTLKSSTPYGEHIEIAN